MSTCSPTMLSLRSIPRFPTITRPLLNFKTPPSLRTHFRSFSSIRITMSTSSTPTTPTTIIEHIVLFKLKPDATPSQISAMMNGLNALSSLPMVRQISAGPLHRDRSTALSFTHLLHSRYDSTDDLAAYSAHPDHVHVVKTHGLPISDDVMAVDWITPTPEPIIKPGSALRIQFVKPKEGLGESENKEILQVVGGLKDKVDGIEGLSFGENFSPARAKGYEIASLAVFKGVAELDAAVESVGVDKEKDKVRDYIDSLVIVDYVVPSSPQSANL